MAAKLAMVEMLKSRTMCSFWSQCFRVGMAGFEGVVRAMEETGDKGMDVWYVM